MTENDEKCRAAFLEFLHTLGPEEEMRPLKYEKAFYAGWDAATKIRSKERNK